MNKELELINKLDLFMENVIYDIELDTILEDANEESEENKAKSDSKVQAFWKAFKEICKQVAHAIKVQIKRIINFITGKRNFFIASKPFMVTKYLFNPCPEIPAYKDNSRQDLFYFIANLVSDSRTRVNKGDKIDIRKVRSAMEHFVNIVDKAEKQSERLLNAKIYDPQEVQYYKKVSGIFKEYIQDAETLMVNAYIYFKKNEMSFAPLKHSDKYDKINAKDPRISEIAKNRNRDSFYESASDINELRASLLIEAADALEESAGRNGLYNRYNIEKEKDDINVAMNRAKENGDYDDYLTFKNIRDNHHSPKIMKQEIKQHQKTRNDKDEINFRRKRNNVETALMDEQFPQESGPKINKTVNNNYPGRYMSKNESVADLLMEAAYMLMDDED